MARDKETKRKIQRDGEGDKYRLYKTRYKLTHRRLDAVEQCKKNEVQERRPSM